MKNLGIGVHTLGPTADAIIDRIVLAEALGVQTAWMTSGRLSPDPMVVFGAAALKTKRIRLGTSIIPTFQIHPLALVQQAVAVDQLAPGRLRLGVGPSHKPVVEGTLGIPFEKPLEQLRDYLTVLNTILKTGNVDFVGKRITARGSLAGPTKVQVLASALRANGFKLCGEMTEGAISWMCPLPYLRDVAAPALREGARAAGRTPPPLIGHVPVIVSEDVAAVREAARQQIGFYPQIPYYSQMLQDAGFPEAAKGDMSDRMIDALVIHGNADQVKERLRALPSYSVDELLATVIEPAGDTKAFERTVKALGELAAE
jgi:F420-dependent oxidoreductase-like protein